jgi:hypothetical protein
MGFQLDGKPVGLLVVAWPITGTGLGLMDGVRAGFHVGDAVSTATGGSGSNLDVGAEDTNCGLGGGEGATVVTIPDCGTLGITVELSKLGALVALTVGAAVDGLALGA